MFADKAELFNSLVQRMCTIVDHQLDLPARGGGSSGRSRLRRVSSDLTQHLHSASSLRYRRCDSQRLIAEEDSPVHLELEGHDEHPPVFAVDDDELG